METPKSTKQCETLVASFNQQIKDMQLIDIKQKFTDYEVITSKLELNRPILITKAVMQRYVELNHRLKQWFKESESRRLWQIVSSLYCWLKKGSCCKKVGTWFEQQLSKRLQLHYQLY